MALRVLFDAVLDPAEVDPLRQILDAWGIEVEAWDETWTSLSGSADALVTEADRLQVVRTVFDETTRTPNLVVLTSNLSVHELRALVCEGIAGVITAPARRPLAQAQAIVAASTGNLVVPLRHAAALGECMDEPPRPLTDDEHALLALAATQSIEAAGRALAPPIPTTIHCALRRPRTRQSSPRLRRGRPVGPRAPLRYVKPARRR